MIVLEGPDASGKSTLASYLAEQLDVPVQSSEGPEQYLGEMSTRLARYAALPPHTIFDRHPCVSDEIYAYALKRPIAVTPDQIMSLYDRKPLFIYCEPPAKVVHHIHKPHDSPEHLLALQENSSRVLQAYHSWAITHAHHIYRIGDDMGKILHVVTNFCADITAFHNKFRIAYDGPPRHLERDLAEFRIKFMLEELCEYADVPDWVKETVQRLVLNSRTGYYDHSPKKNLHNEFDSLIDLVYVALGTAHLQGFDFIAGWARVHRANMAKRRASSASESKREHIADVIKPPGWLPPDLTGLLRGS